jgi:hypothetical protein
MMRGRLVHSPLATEFGRVLASMVLAIPGALAAVLSDDDGDAIDFVHDPRVISELDVQLVGAQIGQCILRLDASARRRRISGPALLVEAERQAFAASAVAERFVVALILDRHANFARALDVLLDARGVLVPLLE